MKSFSEIFTKYLWFTGGFVLGLTLISLGHAALPKRVTPQTSQSKGSLLSEMRGGKVNSPELDQDFEKVNTLEGRYAESWDQQQRLRSATSRVAGVNAPAVRNAPVARNSSPQKRPVAKRKLNR